MTLQAAAARPGARGRRFASALVDLVLLAAPWSSLVGPSGGGNAESGLAVAAALFVYSALASTALLFLDVVFFVRKGRTLGMAVVGIQAEGRHRWLSVLLTPAVVAMSVVGAYVVQYGAVGMGLIRDEVAEVLWPLVPLAILGANLAFVFLPSRRTLIDRICGVRVVRDDAPELSPPARRGAAYFTDVVLLLACGLPSLFAVSVVAHPSEAAPSGIVLLAVVALEGGLWLRARATIGMRAMGLREAIG